LKEKEVDSGKSGRQSKKQKELDRQKKRARQKEIVTCRNEDDRHNMSILKK
jgi:hypothetical protein